MPAASSIKTSVTIRNNPYRASKVVFRFEQKPNHFLYFIIDREQGLSNAEFFGNIWRCQSDDIRIRAANLFVKYVTVNEDDDDQFVIDLNFLEEFCLELKWQEILFEDWKQINDQNLMNEIENQMNNTENTNANNSNICYIMLDVYYNW